jgi:lysophospholipase L1-like esterase
MVFACLWSASCTHSVASASLRDPALNTAVRAVPRDAEWLRRHEEFCEIGRKGGIDVLFLGDSITDGWRRIDEKRGGKGVWDREWAPLAAANFGIGGDRTQHVLWRIENGELDGLNPKVVVLLIGTNNTGLEADKLRPRNTPAEVVAGIDAVLGAIQSKLPNARILLLAVFPRGQSPEDPQRLQIAKINRALALHHDGNRIHFLDIGLNFLSADGSLKPEYMPDFLHPSPAGYQVWADAMRKPLSQLLLR